jgi:hypothetical protein
LNRLLAIRAAIGGALAGALVPAVFALATTACSGGAADPGRSTGVATDDQSGNSGGASGNAGDTGSVGMFLTLPGGAQVSTLAWTITGPNGAATVVKSSTVVVDGLSIKFQVGDIPAATGYRVILSGTSTDTTVSCAGSALFDVTARATTSVSVQLACGAAAAGNHGTHITGTTFNCAAWNSVTANPIETSVGSSVAVSAVATGADPSMLTYAWTAPTGFFDAPSAASANFTCGAIGPVTLVLTVADGPVPAGSQCNPALASTTVTVQCDPTADGGTVFTPPDAGAPDSGAPDGGAPDAGGGTGQPPPPAPAMPPWGLLVLACAMLGVGAGAARRRAPVRQ